MSDKSIRVLLVQDDPGNARLIWETLAEGRNPSVELECANQLATGLQRLAAGGIDVVLLDLTLPDSQGLDTFLRTYAQAPQVPVIVLTRLDDEALAVKAVREGAQDYLVNGQVGRDLLVRSLRYAIEHKRAEAELQARARNLAIKTEQIDALAALSRTGSATLDPTQVLDSVVAATVRLLTVNLAQLWLRDAPNGALRLAVSTGDQDLVAYPWQDSRLGEGPSGLRAHASAPVLVGGWVLGVLTAARRATASFQAEEVTLLGFLAAQAACAVEKVKRYEQLKEMTVSEERVRISREIHDALAQQLSDLYLEIGMLEANTSKSPIREEVRLVMKKAAAVYDEVRKVIFRLKTGVTGGIGLIPALTEYVQKFGRETGIAAKLKVADESATRLSTHAEAQLIRIIQEALVNVRRHAHAKCAWVIFDKEDGKVKVTVQDNGRGFDPEEAMRLDQAFLGLQGMRERAELVAARFKVESQQGKGTRVIVWLPVDAQQAMSRES